MTIPKGWLAALLGAALLLAMLSAHYAKSATQLAARVANAERAAELATARYDSARTTADSLRALSAGAARAAAASAVPHSRATARTQGAEMLLAAARDSALSAARDSTTSLAQMRADVLELMRAESLFVVRVHQERDSASARISRQTVAIAALDQTVAAQLLALHAADEEISALRGVVTTMRAARPNWAHRAVQGLEIVGGSAICGTIGWVAAGPIGLVSATALCAAAAGAIIP